MHHRVTNKETREARTRRPHGRALLPILLLGTLAVLFALAWRAHRTHAGSSAQSIAEHGPYKYTNKLIGETSPYLLEHAHNPVNWYPWGPEALEKAKRENKPIFLSIGYSACHWCHVMEREDFENEVIARVLRYCAWAVEAGCIPRDPSKPAKLVAQEPRPPRHLTDKQEEALIAAVSGSGNRRDRTMLILMLHTGLRAREVCTLKREHVQLGKRSGTLKIWGKRNKYREVPLNATTRAALAEYLPTLPEAQAYLFPSGKTGQALTERALGQLVKRYARKAKLPDVHPHDLRHRFGYRMAESVPLHRLAQIMGHDSLDTTRIYTQGTRSDLQKEVEKIAWA
jgi:integrase/recombinase XerD